MVSVCSPFEHNFRLLRVTTMHIQPEPCIVRCIYAIFEVGSSVLSNLYIQDLVALFPCRELRYL